MQQAQIHPMMVDLEVDLLMISTHWVARVCAAAAAPHYRLPAGRRLRPGPLVMLPGTALHPSLPHPAKADAGP